MPNLPTGICDVCGKTISLDEHGNIRPHGRTKLHGVLMDGCRGTGLPPANDDEDEWLENTQRAKKATDDLIEFIRRVEAKNPKVRRRREDIKELHHILDTLVAVRKAAGMSQSDIANIIGVKQSTISEFENESSDPKVSTLQRYARAVGTQLHMFI